MADLVVPLTYAVAGTESAALVRDYKNHPVRAVRLYHRLIVNWLVWLTVTIHERCIGAAVGTPVSLRVVVPSLTSRPGLHPLTRIARSMSATTDAALVPTLDALCDHAVRSDKFALQPRHAGDGRLVLVLDDVWTTGSNAQSAAPTLRGAGAAAVSVLVVGRSLNPDYRPPHSSAPAGPTVATTPSSAR